MENAWNWWRKRPGLNNLRVPPTKAVPQSPETLQLRVGPALTPQANSIPVMDQVIGRTHLERGGGLETSTGVQFRLFCTCTHLMNGRSVSCWVAVRGLQQMRSDQLRSEIVGVPLSPTMGCMQSLLLFYFNRSIYRLDAAGRASRVLGWRYPNQPVRNPHSSGSTLRAWAGSRIRVDESEVPQVSRQPVQRDMHPDGWGPGRWRSPRISECVREWVGRGKTQAEPKDEAHRVPRRACPYAQVCEGWTKKSEPGSRRPRWPRSATGVRGAAGR